MAFTVIIPARYASTRLPGKPLLEIAGKPMVQHVHEQALASGADDVIIATDDESIRDTAEGFGARVLLTREDHPSGTDRLEEVATRLGFDDDAILVNVQGDEPLMPPALIGQVAENLAAFPDAGVATLCEPIENLETVFNPNAVKVVFDHRGMACYFSRAPIPWARDAFMAGRPESLPEGIQWYRHLGIYAYRAGLLRDFVRWPPAPLETVESLEQLRFLHHGRGIHVAVAAESPPPGVDTQADLDQVRQILEARHG